MSEGIDLPRVNVTKAPLKMFKKINLGLNIKVAVYTNTKKKVYKTSETKIHHHKYHLKS